MTNSRALRRFDFPLPLGPNNAIDFSIVSSPTGISNVFVPDFSRRFSETREKMVSSLKDR